VARWYLDRTRYIGHMMPGLRHVAVSLNGEPLMTGRGQLRHDLDGLCAGDFCILPFKPSKGNLHGWAKKEREAFARAWRRRASADIIHVMAGPIADAIYASSIDEDVGWMSDPYANATDWRWLEADRAFEAEGGERGSDSWQVEQRIDLLGRRWRLHIWHCAV
jgi:hypothetical protein